MQPSSGRQIYGVYGQIIASDVPLPELPHGTGTPDIVVRQCDLERPDRPCDRRSSTRRVYEAPEGQFSVLETAEGVVWSYESGGAVRIAKGREITVATAEDVPADRRRQLVLGPGLRTVLIQQGHLVLHGSAVVIDGRAVAFVGESGVGKSTTAAAFYAHGHDVLSDDVTPIYETDDGYTVPAGVPTVKIRPHIANAVAPSLDPVVPESSLERRYYEASGPNSGGSYPLESLYVLERGDTLSIDTPRSRDLLPSLLRESYPLYDETDSEAAAAHFETCAGLMDRVPMKRLRRPDSVDRLDELVELVETEVRPVG